MPVCAWIFSPCNAAGSGTAIPAPFRKEKQLKGVGASAGGFYTLVAVFLVAQAGQQLYVHDGQEDGGVVLPHLLQDTGT